MIVTLTSKAFLWENLPFLLNPTLSPQRITILRSAKCFGDYLSDRQLDCTVRTKKHNKTTRKSFVYSCLRLLLFVRVQLSICAHICLFVENVKLKCTVGVATTFWFVSSSIWDVGLFWVGHLMCSWGCAGAHLHYNTFCHTRFYVQQIMGIERVSCHCKSQSFSQKKLSPLRGQIQPSGLYYKSCTIVIYDHFHNMIIGPVL